MSELLKLSLKELWSLRGQISLAIMIKLWPVYVVIGAFIIIYIILAIIRRIKK